uniref:Eyes shut homolog n=1 Tax=Cyprinodon variegatus TaxID=28743 RepID=A0A3Q2DF61_CYPVA
MWVSFFCLIVIYTAVHITKCQTVCNRQEPLEWNLNKHTIQMNWTLIGKLCKSDFECWGSPGEGQVRQPYNFPQLCPLQLQHGDKLLMYADETLKSYGIRLFNVSREDFESCITNADLKNQFVFPHKIKESEHVEAKWITPGHHYFIALHEGDSQLCKLGLRLNVTVKTQLCRASPFLRLCSGNGLCRTDFYKGAYHCQCHHNYFGRFCERFDACLDNPCQNKGVCLSNGSTDPKDRTYKCLCPPHFTGKRLHCESNIDECMSAPCLHGRCSCVDLIDKYACFCLDGFTGKTCETDIDICKDTSFNVSLCFNGATCIDGEGSNFTCM